MHKKPVIYLWNNVNCQVGLTTSIEKNIELPDIELYNGTIVAKFNTGIQSWKFKCSKYQQKYKKF